MSKIDVDTDELRRALLAALPLLAITSEAEAQDAARVQPSAYRVVLENERLRVLEFNSRPGMGVCGNGMHSHPPHLNVALSPAKASIRLPNGTSIVAENKLGDVWWSEAETHEVENISGRDVRALIIELKPPTDRS
jgi:hypothetical protein